MSLSQQLEKFISHTFAGFPWQITITDWTDHTYAIGQGNSHWYGKPLVVKIHTQEAGRDLLKLNGLRFLERFLAQEVDMEGNFYILASLKHYASIRLTWWQLLATRLRHNRFQTVKRAAVNVKSHYDIPQALLEKYLDTKYMAYSCGMFADTNLGLDALPALMHGTGKTDTHDSLEKAQWRKFKDAVDFIAPKPGETLLDVGCGYGGQLLVALEEQPFAKVVGWTHSHNQVTKGRQWLSDHNKDRWELNEGDYRQDNRVFDHITSTGMISHVGPRGLTPYVKNIRRRIHTGGRYVHHSLMTTYSAHPLDAQVGIAFNKKYVWPGFHWFTLADHIRALEQNGFRVEKVLNLKSNYNKTITAWYERMMQHRAEIELALGVATFRAWQVYLGGGAGPDSGDINRIYCRAV